MKAVLAHVGHVHGGLHGQEEQRPQDREFFPGQIHGARRPALIQNVLHLLQHRDQPLRLLVAAGFRQLDVLGQLPAYRLQIRERKFGVDGLDVGDRIDLAGDVHDVRVLEAAHHVRDGIGLANVGQELVPQAFTLGCACHQPRDVDELDHRRNDFLRLGDSGKHRQARVGHLDDADVRLNGTERIILRRDPRLGQRVEQRGFADVGQADDTAFE